MLDVGPAAVVVDVDRPVEEGTVEAGEFAGIRAVDRDDGKAGDGHAEHLHERRRGTATVPGEFGA
jgi:hypothetical protein